MKLTLTCKAILFDVDGTLVNSEACVNNIWQKWAAKYHIDPSEVLLVAHGRTIMETLQIVAPHLASEKHVLEVQDIAVSELKYVKEVSGAKSFLQQIPSDYWAVVTSGAKRVSQSSMINAGLPIPDVLIAAEDVTCGKPSPEPYLKAAKQLNLLPEECLIFEDSPSGIESGIASGAKVITLTTTHQASELPQSVAYVKDFSNILATVLDNNGEMYLKVTIF